MVRKHKLLKTFTDLNFEKQVRDPNSVRSKNLSNRSLNVVSPPSLCHGSESCGCFCHYAQDDPPPCYNCCQDPEQSDDYSLARKVLLGKKDSLSRGKSHHIKDYILRDEFGFEIPKYRKKNNKKILNLSKVLNGESSSTFTSNAKDSLRLNRGCSVSQVEDLNVEKLLIAANKSVNHRTMVNNIFNGGSHRNTMLSQEEIDSRVSLEQTYPIPMSHRIPTPCRQKVGRSKPKHAMRDNFGLEVRHSDHKGCTVS